MDDQLVDGDNAHHLGGQRHPAGLRGALPGLRIFPGGNQLVKLHREFAAPFGIEVLGRGLGGPAEAASPPSGLEVDFLAARVKAIESPMKWSSNVATVEPSHGVGAESRSSVTPPSTFFAWRAGRSRSSMEMSSDTIGFLRRVIRQSLDAGIVELGGRKFRAPQPRQPNISQAAVSPRGGEALLEDSRGLAGKSPMGRTSKGTPW